MANLRLERPGETLRRRQRWGWRQWTVLGTAGGILASAGWGITHLLTDAVEQRQVNREAKTLMPHYRGATQQPAEKEEAMAFARFVAAAGLLPRHVQTLDSLARVEGYADTSRTRPDTLDAAANRRWANGYDILETLWGRVHEGKVDEEWIRALGNSAARLQGPRLEKRMAGIRFLKALNESREESVRQVLNQLSRVEGGRKATLEDVQNLKKRLEGAPKNGARSSPAPKGGVQYAHLMPTAQALALKQKAVLATKGQFAGRPFRIRSRL